MSELTTEQLIKIIIGVLVVVAVVISVFMFFRFKVIDFFKGYIGEEPEGGVGNQTGGGTNEIGETNTGTKPKRLCEDCPGGIACKTEDCQKISEELKPFNKKCEYKSTYVLGISIANRCTTTQL